MRISTNLIVAHVPRPDRATSPPRLSPVDSPPATHTPREPRHAHPASTATVEPETATLQDEARRGGIAGAPTPLPPPGSTVKVAIATPTGTYTVSFISAQTYAQTAANLTAAISRAEATPTNTA